MDPTTALALVLLLPLVVSLLHPRSRSSLAALASSERTPE